MHVRLAHTDDTNAVAAIYAPIVRETATSFEETEVPATEMAHRMARVLEHLPWLVAESETQVVGYAYASRFRDRAAYRWSVEVSVYVAEGHRGQGIGRRLYEVLFELLRRQGFCTALAGITLPNLASVALHESMGFRSVGVYRKVGFKFGVWHDVGWWSLPLGDYDDDPAEPLPLSRVSQPG